MYYYSQRVEKRHMNVEIVFVVKIVNFSCKWTENNSYSVLIKFVECLNYDRIGSLFRHEIVTLTQRVELEHT